MCLGGCIALSAWAVYSDEDAVCLIRSSFWRAITPQRCCSSNTCISPSPSNCAKYGDSLDIVADIFKNIAVGFFVFIKLTP